MEWYPAERHGEWCVLSKPRASRRCIEHCIPPLASPFAEVQEKVADLLKDRILVGHAVHNDLKVRSLQLNKLRVLI